MRRHTQPGPTVADVVAVYGAVSNPAFPQHILDLTCGCGARLQLQTRWGETMRKERAAFDVAHEPCRQRPDAPEPPPMPVDHPQPMQQAVPHEGPTALGFTTPATTPDECANAPLCLLPANHRGQCRR